MSSEKRPLGLGAARLAKKRKIEHSESNGSAPDENRKIASTGSALEDLEEMLHTALSATLRDGTEGASSDASAWYRAVVHEADRLLRLQQSTANAETEDEEGERLPQTAQKWAQVNVAFGRALLGLGSRLTSEDSKEERKPGEPGSMTEWIDAASLQLEAAREHTSATPSFLWLDSLIKAHNLGAGQPGSSLKDVIKSFKRISTENLPVDATDAASLVMQISQDHEDDSACPDALRWVKEVFELRLAKASLGYCHLMIASHLSDKLEDLFEDEEPPSGPEVDELKESATKAADIFAVLLADARKEGADEELIEKLQKSRGEALITSAMYTADVAKRDELYQAAETELGSLNDESD